MTVVRTECVYSIDRQDRDDDNEAPRRRYVHRNRNASESDYYLARRYYRLGGPDGAILTRYTISLSEVGKSAVDLGVNR